MDEKLFEILRQHPVTRELSAEGREHLLELGSVIGYLPGTYVFHVNQPRRAFGVLLKGRLELRAGQRGRARVLAVLGPGDSFGEGSLLDDYPHSTSAYVAEALEAFEVPREALTTLSRERPDLYSRLVSGAIRLITERVSSASAWMAGSV